jgi:hypothetical protein
MTDYVRFTRGGLVAYRRDGDTRREMAEPITSRVLACLRLRCEIDEDVTLGDIFIVVSGFPELVAFISQYSMCPVQAFHDQALSPRKEEEQEEREPLRYIEIGKVIEIDKELTDYLDLVAIGTPDENGTTRYAIDLTPVNEVAHLPVKLKPVAEIRERRGKVSEQAYVYTLLEVLDAIYYEISFYGGPEETATFAKELSQEDQDLDAGQLQTITLDAIRQEFESK